MIGNVIAATDCTPEMMFDRPVEAVEFPLGKFGDGRKTQRFSPAGVERGVYCDNRKAAENRMHRQKYI